MSGRLKACGLVQMVRGARYSLVGVHRFRQKWCLDLEAFGDGSRDAWIVAQCWLWGLGRRVVWRCGDDGGFGLIVFNGGLKMKDGCVVLQMMKSDLFC